MSINVAIKASNGQYVTCKEDNNFVLTASSSTVGDSETFQMINQGVYLVAFQASNGKYVTNSLNGDLPLAATADDVSLAPLQIDEDKKVLSQSTECFDIQDTGNDSFALYASNGRYVQLDTTSSVLQALGGDIISDSSATTFEIIPLSDDSSPIPPPPPPSERMMSKSTALKDDNTPVDAYTVCFCGTGCTRDEGEESRPHRPKSTKGDSDKDIYCKNTGYIPVRIHKEISIDLKAKTPSVTIRGVGENDWATPADDSEKLTLDGPLNADQGLLDYVKPYNGGDQFSYTQTQLDGWSAPALALHAANLAASSGKNCYNFIGHSRGAVEAIMAAWFLYAYGSEDVKMIPVNIFAIDPVPGTGEWYGILTQLPPNVQNYVGVYAWDMLPRPFMAVVPRPNQPMTGKDINVKLSYSGIWAKRRWMHLADRAQLADPLKPSSDPQPKGYQLFACRGAHSTVAGNYTSDGGYKSNMVSSDVAPVPELVYKMARGYLTKWGTKFQQESAVPDRVLELRQAINTYHRDFDNMGSGDTRDDLFGTHLYVRLVSSRKGRNPFATDYLDDVVGDPPYKMDYPVTAKRKNAGWVKWQFL